MSSLDIHTAGEVSKSAASVKRQGRQRYFWLVIVLIYLVCIEAASYLIASRLSGLAVFYKPDNLSSVNYGDYMANRDPDLGWPTRNRLSVDLDSIGARREPAFPDPSVEPLMSVYGDSFIYCAEVDDESAWPNVLAQNV